jgi:phosphatidate phosphatase APP1
MKSALLVLATTLLLSGPSYAKTLVVSDIDDTIKLTDVLNTNTEIVINALFSKKAFSGMSALYREFDKNKASIHYVSGSPTVIKNIIGKFMGFNVFPQAQNLNLRANKVESYDHKIASISRLIETENPDEIILIGDDGEKDPEIYDAISKKYPRKVSGIYIRAIQNRALPANGLMRNFFSSVEIAGVEHVKGNLSASAVSSVVKSFIAQDNGSELVIKKRYCPADGRLELDEIRQQVKEQSTVDEMEKAQAKIIKTCSTNTNLFTRK